MRRMVSYILCLVFLVGVPLEIHGEEVFKAMTIRLRDYGSDDVAYLVVPYHPPKAGVVLVPDGYGSGEPVRKLCQDLARDGYLVLLVDLYNGKTSENPEGAVELEKWLDDKLVARAVRTGVNFFEQSPRFQMKHVEVLALGGGASGALAAMEKEKRVSSIGLLYPRKTLSYKRVLECEPSIFVLSNDAGSSFFEGGRWNELEGRLSWKQVELSYEGFRGALSGSPWNEAMRGVFEEWARGVKVEKEPGLLNKIFD